MHILDVLKPKRRGAIQRRKSQGSILDVPKHTGLDPWDARPHDPYSALDGKFSPASQHASAMPNGSSLPPSPLSEWNMVDAPRRTRARRANTVGSVSIASDDTVSVRSESVDTVRGVPRVRRGWDSPFSAHRNLRPSSPSNSSTGLTSPSSTSLALFSPASFVDIPGGSARMHAPHTLPHMTGTPVRHPTQRSTHGSIHQVAKRRDVHPPRNASPTPSSMSSSIMHTLDNGTKIHVPTSPSPERGRSLARMTEEERAKRQTFYIVPPGMNVIFTDDQGVEIARVGEFSAAPDPVRYRESPIILKDEQGRIIYETGKGERTTYDFDDEFNGDRPNVIHLGNFVPERFIVLSSIP
ncbi:hypothetical protein K488DRAFT_89978 [Vararia minispora EC-137]|uniref:Uncharacterized protein n=1 Tax=Vararia minispora EC-137 TaxID=1314806 RepID=A0ACB8Q8T2_9AGAM|nr:hypothetical protein K488DRAFT_89978 [Vararia minispora EC-137]